MRLFILIIFCFLSRIIPHPPNFTAVFAFSLWLGFQYKKQPHFWFLALIPMMTADFFLGPSGISFIVYANLLATSWIGHAVGDRRLWIDMGLKSFLSSAFFFLTVNFGVWRMSGMYPLDTTGLLSCYTSALPFYTNQLLSTFLFAVAFEKGTQWNFARPTSTVNVRVQP